MKIRMDKDIVSFVPDNEAEAVELEALWIKMGNCVGGTKRLEPMGVYVRDQDKLAKFHIEGLSEQEVKENPVVLAPYDTDVYCSICNRTEHVKKGQPIPVCCGRLMEILD